MSFVHCDQIKHDSEGQEDAENHARRPGEHVAGLAAKCGLATRSAKRAGEPAAASFLDQDQQHEEDADKDKQDFEDVEQSGH